MLPAARGTVRVWRHFLPHRPPIPARPKTLSRQNGPPTRRHILQEPSTPSCQRVGGNAFVSLLLWELQHCRMYLDTAILCTACITFRKVLTVNCVIGLHSTKQPVSKDTRRASCAVGTAILILLRTNVSGFKMLTEQWTFLYCCTVHFEDSLSTAHRQMH